MKTPSNPTKLRPGHSSNEGRKKYPRLRIEAALKDAGDKGMTRRELRAATDCSQTLVNETLKSMLRTNCVHHDGAKPEARFRMGPPQHVEPPPNVARGRAIDVWALPVYVPPAWNVREGAGRVCA